MLTPAIERVADVHEIMVGSASMGTDRGRLHPLGI